MVGDLPDDSVSEGEHVDDADDTLDDSDPLSEACT